MLKTTAAAGAAAATGAAFTSPALAQDGDLSGWFDNVSNFDGVADHTGEDSVTVEVGVEANNGPYGFGPAAIRVDPGTEVTWEWVEGNHNVAAEDGSYESELTGESGFTFTQTFDEEGVSRYACTPHKTMGMKGAVVVGTDYPTAGGGGEGAVETLAPEEAGVPIQPHFVGIATGLAIIVSLIFTFFTLKYGESPHTSGGND